MADCQIDYIPNRLHWNEREVLEIFHPEEFLYRRLNKDQEKKAPYSTISLIDLSFNRSGIGATIISEREDVLWNFDTKIGFQRYELEISDLKVGFLNLEVDSKRIFNCPDYGNDNETIMQVVHDPDDCNYAHSVICFYYNGVETTFDNWKETLGSKRCKKLRKTIKDELHKAMVRTLGVN